MIVKRTYVVAGHAFSVSCPDWVLSSYAPFEWTPDIQEAESTISPLFSLDVVPEDDMAGLLAPYSLITRCNEEPPYLWLYANKTQPAFDNVLFGFSLDGTNCASFLEIPAQMESGNCRLKVRRRILKQEMECCINNALMLLYTMYTTLQQTLMIHSSVTVYEGKAYAFLGKSGTGKSTHSSLWLKHIPGTWLLNDDNPVVRLIEGQAYIYGSPWSGKTPCYKNERVPLGGIVQLSQAPYNEITRLQGIEAYAAFLPSCSSLKWKRKLEDCLCATVESVVSSVGVYHLNCLPDEEAARLCNSQITND